jgi:TolB-like protein
MLGHRVSFGRFVADFERGSLLRDGQPVAIGHKAFLLLQTFLRAPGVTLDKAALMEAVWPGTAVEESNLSVQVAALRKLLAPSADSGDWIVTIPRTGYRFVGKVVSETGALADRESAARPSVAVLPFAMVGADADSQYVADGISEDVITALMRYRWFRVAARGPSFAHRGQGEDLAEMATRIGVRYIVSGSVRHAGPQWRISAQLTDTEAGHHVWAERYQLDFEDVFAIQDEIAERVAGAIEPELLQTESRHAAARHTGNMTSWDLVRRGTWHFHKITRNDHLTARELFRRACAIDPQLGEAHIWLARASAGICGYGWSATPAEDIEEGLHAARQAIHLDPQNAYAHYALAITNAYADMPGPAALAAARAIELAPSFALGHLVLGMARLFAGQAKDAIEPFEHGLRLNPNDPQNFVWYNLLAFAQLFADHPAEARSNCQKALGIRPNWRPTLETMACTLVAMDEIDEAGNWLARAQHMEPVEGDIFAPMRRLNPHWRDRLSEMLQRAEAKTGRFSIL